MGAGYHSKKALRPTLMACPPRRRREETLRPVEHLQHRLGPVVLRDALHDVDLSGTGNALRQEDVRGHGCAGEREVGHRLGQRGRHCATAGAVRPQAICSSMPLAIGPQAVVCAPSRAA